MYIKKKLDSKQEISYQCIKNAILGNKFEPNETINGSKNNKLMTFTKTILDQINRFAATTTADIERLKILYEEHKKIFELNL